MPPQPLTISYMGQLHSHEMLQQSLSISPQYLALYSPLAQTYSQLQVSLQSHHWMVLRTHSQIQQFVQYLEKHYSIEHPQSRQKLSRVEDKYVIRLQVMMKSGSVDLDDKRVVEFFQIYDLQFNKVKSLTLKKKSGGRYVDKLCCQCSWRERSFVITPNGLLYHKTKNSEKRICEYISFNKYFELHCGIETGSEWGIVVRSYHRKLNMYARNLQEFVVAVYFLSKAYAEFDKGKHANVYGAFSSPKDNNNIEFLVDGQEYFAAVAKAISKAKHQVMIAGWWISPQFYLIRPIDPKQPQKNRLSTILKQIITKNNVKIYILAYRQSAMFLPNDSKYTKQALQSISPNIKVITHPINIIPSLWSHHQKIVIIDQKVAFIGGLDLCYGRYDTSQHSIKDKENLYPGIEFNNSRIKDFQKVREYEMSNIMRSKHPRLPWHDVSVRMVGGSVGDVVRHFVEYWNNASYQALYQQRIVLVPESTKIKTKIKKIVVGIRNKLWHTRQENENSQQGANYLNTSNSPRKKSIDHSMKNMITSQMQDHPNKKPLQDILNYQYTTFSSGQQLEPHQKPGKDHKQPQTNFTQPQLHKKTSLPQRTIINNTHQLPIYLPNSQQQYYDSDNGQYLNERSYDFEQQHRGVIEGKRHRWSWVMSREGSEKGKSRSRGKKTRKMSQKSINEDKMMQLPVDTCQILRSVSKWSIGCKQTQPQASIHAAYLDLIQSSQHFIYIQNQFFMSATQNQKVLKNLVAQALIQRISRAIAQKRKFRVIFFLPLIPGFAGELDQPQAVLPRVIMHWQFLTIYNCDNSVIRSIAKLTPDPSKYIQFYGLRTHNMLKDGPVTEIIYLHTKLMIVDDKKAILGSANINDRSLRGTRDSEIAMVVSGGKQVDSIINGKECRVNEKIMELRIKLMREHFGTWDSEGKVIDFRDVLDSVVNERLEKIAEQNGDIYRNLFGCYPDNNIETLKDLRKNQRTPTKQQYFAESKNIHGHVVHFPYKFLCKQNLLEGNTIYPNGITT